MNNTSLNLRRWWPSSEPQTLQIAVALLYWNAFFGVIFGLLAGGTALYFLLVLAEVAGGLGVANERKWGYFVALLAAVVPLGIVAISHFAGVSILNVIFQIALVVALVHPMSRSYYKIWFR